MTRQNIATGAVANDGTGDTLRAAATKINDNFVELYQHLGNDSNVLSSYIVIDSDAIVFEGYTPDANETFLKASNVSTDRTITLPDLTGTIVLDQGSQTLTSKTLNSPQINSPKIGTGLFDSNGNEVITLVGVAGATEQVQFTNATNSSADHPSITVTGPSSNINLEITGKGTGSVNISKAAYTSVEVTTSTTASAAASYIILNGTGIINVGLANGTTVGEYKVFTNKSTSLANVFPSSFAVNGKTYVQLEANHGSVQLIWDGSDWFIAGASRSPVTF